MNIVIERGDKDSNGKPRKLKDLPEYSIALDGFVQGPELDTENHRYSFDHHHGCLRYCTTATCVQAWTAVMGGLDPAKYTVYINDVDIDVCMSIWILKNPDRCNEPMVKRLVEAIGLGDMHAGAISLNGLTKVCEWVAAPQTDSLRNGDYHKISDDSWKAILESIMHRITQYVNGEASADIADRVVSSGFEIKRNENGWVLVESNDPHVYTSLWRSGFDRVVLLRPREDNLLTVLLAKRTDFIDNFPLGKIFAELHKLEPGWGGGSTIGGAPRDSGTPVTKLPLETIIEVVNACVEGRSPDITPVKKQVRKKTSKKSSKKNA